MESPVMSHGTCHSSRPAGRDLIPVSHAPDPTPHRLAPVRSRRRARVAPILCALGLLATAGAGLLAAPDSADAQTRRRTTTRVTQSRMPDQGTAAVGGSAGFFFPSDEAFEASPIIEGFGEYYVTPRVSLRGRLAFTDPSLDREDDDSLRQIQLGFDAIYNWERGKWHPFVGGGLGVHFLQAKDNGRDFGDSRSEPSFNALGGIEYFINRTVSLKGEGRYQWVDDVVFGDPSGFVATFGVKKYF